MNANRLTPEGAARLRIVRERFREHPEDYTNQGWFCGTRGCVAGWLCVDAERVPENGHEYPHVAAELLGLRWVAGTPIGGLFTTAHHDPASAITAIDKFLWLQGYPSDAIADAEDTPDLELAMVIA